MKRSREASTGEVVKAQSSKGSATSYVGFFRGLNVSGHNVIKMEALRTALLAAGALSARTYIQSGNCAFSLPQSLVPEAFVPKVMTILEASHGVKNSLLTLRSQAELRDILGRFKVDKEMDEKHVMCFLFDEAIVPRDQSTLAKQLEALGEALVTPSGSNETKQSLKVREVVVWYKSGSVGASKLQGRHIAKALGCGGTYEKWTARNWITLRSTLQLAECL